MMFTQQETGCLALPAGIVTGSSIMPQTKNYDLFEIMRANGSVFGSLQQQVQETIVGFGSGYHWDLQCTRGAVVEVCGFCFSTLKLMLEAVLALKVKAATLRNGSAGDWVRVQLPPNHQCNQKSGTLSGAPLPVDCWQTDTLLWNAEKKANVIRGVAVRGDSMSEAQERCDSAGEDMMSDMCNTLYDVANVPLMHKFKTPDMQELAQQFLQ
eukprot:CAMPEP_0172741962 /NCGR_PEP_ID=MMETSP1074-20121228/128377_1 /TAXON_ID=2916 /ORGANISM="Ceratium fusus, Strain PA161109" /LENGTH=210 /DNA_ID=CAMNT_0013572397 /DNA_START=87 /DNA_END=719 /DNA_ORIENTATION=+